MAQYTISHSEENKGWPTFWSYVPDWFARLGNRFYTIKNGQLWEHHDTDNPVVNNFYGVQYASSIKTVFNEAMADDKAFKTIVIEGDRSAWDIALATNYTNSSIEKDKFNTRESRHFAFVRQNENAEDLHGGAAQGIGVITASAGTVITVNRAPEFVNTGDVLKQVNGLENETIGTITGVVGNQVTVQVIVTAPVSGLFVFAQKNARAEGSDVRGYYMEILMTDTETTQNELFAVSSEVSKSYV